MLLDLLLSLIGIIVTIFIVVGVHEGAHFLVARLLGIKVLRFSIGFGKALYSWRDKQGTEYVLAPFPLGGYVKLLDENEGEVADEEKSLAFNRQPLYKRMAVVIAGPFSNLLMAFFLYWLIFVIGFQTLIPIIGSVDRHSIASQAGLKPQQELISIDNQQTLRWPSVTMRLVMHTGNQDTVTIATQEFNNKASPVEIHHLNLESWQMNNLKPDPLSSLGITPYMPEPPLIIGKIKPLSPAAISLQLGDKIIALNGKAIAHWEQLMTFTSKNPDQRLTLTIQRHHQPLEISLILGHHWELLFHKTGFLGVGPQIELPEKLIRKIQYNPFTALRQASNEVLELSYLNLLLFQKLITHKLSVLSLGGPITIFESAGSAFQYGIVPFLSFLAFLNVALGIINFFPIPGLDGGHLLFQAIELLLRRPVSLKVQMLFYRLGFILLVFVLIQALTNDVLRLWS